VGLVTAVPLDYWTAPAGSSTRSAQDDGGVLEVADPWITLTAIPLPPNESGSAQWSCRLPVSAGQGRPRSRDAGPAQRRPAHARGRPRQRPVRTGALDHRRQPGTPDQLAEVVAELSTLRRGVGIAEAQPYDIVADVEPGTDPVPYAAAGATWWLIGHTTSTRVGAEKWRTS
jgi:hypothetical protein